MITVPLAITTSSITMPLPTLSSPRSKLPPLPTTPAYFQQGRCCTQSMCPLLAPLPDNSILSAGQGTCGALHSNLQLLPPPIGCQYRLYVFFFFRVTLRSFANGSTTKAKRMGDNGHPCLVLLLKRNQKCSHWVYKTQICVTMLTPKLNLRKIL